MQKTILITGATSGIGLEAAKILADKGCKLYFTARDKGKAEKTLQEFISTSGNNDISYFLCDFASLKSVKELAETVSAALPKLDVLINNAGVWEMEFKDSTDGIEMNFAVNYLAPFLLTNLLLPVLEKAEHARIINTSSMAHRRNILHLDDIEFRHQPYNGVSTYSQSKLCNLLFTLKLSSILKPTGITVNAVHPGYVKTNLFNQMGTRDWGNVPDAAEGARATIYTSLSNEVANVTGKYFFEEHEHKPTEMALNAKLADELWDLTVKMVAKYLPES